LEKTGEDSFSTIDFATERIKTILTITRKIEFKLQYLFDLLFTFIGRFIQPVMNLVIIGLLGKNVVDGSMTFGAFVLVITYYNILQSMKQNMKGSFN
jgi:ABC-type bacteriocin/lantibiotic exporter with double-glycine peptidase domain